MSDRPLMKCGHTAQGIEQNSKKPVCVICMCDEIAENVPDLSGRQAKCSDCGFTVDSKYSLPFFAHKPSEKFDRYYCGCYGWD